MVTEIVIEVERESTGGFGTSSIHLCPTPSQRFFDLSKSYSKVIATPQSNVVSNTSIGLPCWGA